MLFYPKNTLVKEVIPCPKPTSVPEWIKHIPVYTRGSSLIVENGESNYSVKSCIPFMDTFSTGYTFELWCDIQIRQVNGVPRITWRSKDEQLSPVISREPHPSHLPIYEGFDPFTFSWVSHWGIETPKNYSCLFTHPLNRTDLPFITTSGVMDTDRWGIWGNQPFALKTGWEGVLPAGTPIIQVIPFKREPWTSEITKNLKKSNWGVLEEVKINSKFRGYYKSKYWSRKFYT